MTITTTLILRSLERQYNIPKDITNIINEFVEYNKDVLVESEIIYIEADPQQRYYFRTSTTKIENNILPFYQAKKIETYFDKNRHISIELNNYKVDNIKINHNLGKIRKHKNKNIVRYNNMKILLNEYTESVEIEVINEIQKNELKD